MTEQPGTERYLARHLALADRILDCLDRALDDPRELFTAVVRKRSTKTDEEEVYGCERDTIDEKKLQGVVAAFAELKDIQRQALGILEPKDAQRLDVDRAKAGVQTGDGLRSLLAALDTTLEV